MTHQFANCQLPQFIKEERSNLKYRVQTRSNPGKGSDRYDDDDDNDDVDDDETNCRRLARPEIGGGRGGNFLISLPKNKMKRIPFPQALQTSHVAMTEFGKILHKWQKIKHSEIFIRFI